MDSITQAALGAACGEAVLGHKIGNKAILWGAIAGTISDLDVVSRVFIESEVYGLLYHRGLTHSILFTLIGAPLLAWLAQKHRAWLSMGFFGLIWLFIGSFALESPNLITLGLTLALSGLGVWLGIRLFGKQKKERRLRQEPTFMQWTWLFFFAILTHWFIDACTSYGTQIYEPFSSYRVSFNNIAIVDPLYTVPLLIFLILVGLFRKKSARRVLNWIGLTLSSGYMIFTFYAKSIVNQVVLDNLKEQDIEYEEFLTYPTIFNAILWQTTIKTDTGFYYGAYSLMDEAPLIEFIPLPKNHELLAPYKEEREVEILEWFAQDYYNVTNIGEDTLQFNNLRFGILGFGVVDFPDPYIFKFRIYKKDNEVVVEEYRGDMEQIDFGQAFSVLWRRIWGDKTKEAAKIRKKETTD